MANNNNSNNNSDNNNNDDRDPVYLLIDLHFKNEATFHEKKAQGRIKLLSRIPKEPVTFPEICHGNNNHIY